LEEKIGPGKSVILEENLWKNCVWVCLDVPGIMPYG
jgi:hypothetical protein